MNSEIINALIKKHYPERYWVKDVNGLWHSEKVTPEIYAEREKWVRKSYKLED